MATETREKGAQTKPEEPAGGRPRWVLAAGGLGLVLAGGIGFVLLRGDDSADEQPDATTTTTRPLSPAAKDHQVAYLSSDANGTTVFLTDGQGSSVKPVAQLTGRAEHLLWSPDGSRLLLDGDASGEFEVQVVDATSGAVTVLAGSATSSEGGASWSPDGTKVAFFSDRDGRFAGYVIDAAGGTAQRITPPDLAAVNDLTWSPDGRQLAFATADTLESQIWVVDADGANPRKVGDLVGATQPAWSPDGKSLAVSAQPAGEPTADIYVLDVASGAAEKLAATEYRDAFALWAPDGESLYFTAEVPNEDNDGGAADDIFRVDVASGEVTSVIADGISVESEMALTADGELLAFSLTRSGDKEIFVANSDGTGAIPLSRAPERSDSFATWRPGTGPTP